MVAITEDKQVADSGPRKGVTEVEMILTHVHQCEDAQSLIQGHSDE